MNYAGVNSFIIGAKVFLFCWWLFATG